MYFLLFLQSNREVFFLLKIYLQLMSVTLMIYFQCHDDITDIKNFIYIKQNLLKKKKRIKIY